MTRCCLYFGCNPEQVQVTVDPKTGEATFVVKTNDPTFADEMQKFLKAKDFAENVNKGISENSQNLPDRTREAFAINDVTVNSLFQKPQKITFHNFRRYLSKFSISNKLGI